MALPRAASRRSSSCAIVATHERDAHFLALSGERSPADRRDLSEGDRTARVVKEGLQVAERCGATLGLEHGRARYAARASVAWLGWRSFSATFQGISSSMRLIG